MKSIDNLFDIFSILHDGKISVWTGNKNVLTLTIDCPYLAGRIDKSFFSFFIDFIQVDDLQLTTWPNPAELPVLTLTQLHDIFKAPLEILSVEKNGDVVIVACNQHDPAFDYVGGNLSISCEEIKIYDQNEKEMTIDQVDNLSKSYWVEVGKEFEKKMIEQQKKLKGDLD
jgi:hypothetical protein